MFKKHYGEKKFVQIKNKAAKENQDCEEVLGKIYDIKKLQQMPDKAYKNFVEEKIKMYLDFNIGINYVDTLNYCEQSLLDKDVNNRAIFDRYRPKGFFERLFS